MPIIYSEGVGNVRELNLQMYFPPFEYNELVRKKPSNRMVIEWLLT